MSALDLRRKNWVIPFLRALANRFDEQAARARLSASGGSLESTYEAWLTEALRSRGLLTGAPTRAWHDEGTTSRRLADQMFLDTLAHQVEMLLELRLLHGLSIDGVADQIQVLMVLAAACEEYDAAEQLYELSLDEWGPRDDPRREALARAMGPTVRLLGEALKETGHHAANQPLLGLPFHHVLDYAATCHLMRIGHEQFGHGGRIDEPALRQLQADAHMCPIPRNHPAERGIGPKFASLVPPGDLGGDEWDADRRSAARSGRRGLGRGEPHGATTQRCELVLRRPATADRLVAPPWDAAAPAMGG